MELHRALNITRVLKVVVNPVVGQGFNERTNLEANHSKKSIVQFLSPLDSPS